MIKKHASLFAGMGGFDLAAQWMGWENVFHCEWNPFGQRILKYYWPNAISYGDITKTDFTIHRGTIDVLSGGFPCQPYSVAGKRKGKEDERHLWPEMLRAIREIQPRWVVGENVRGIVSWNRGMVFDEVQSELEAEGYEVLPFLLPAAGVNAPHRRDRIWFIAHRIGNGQQRTDTVQEKHSGGIQEGMGEGYESVALHDGGISSDTPNIGLQQPRHSRERWSGFEDNNNSAITNTNGERLPGQEHGRSQPGWTTAPSAPNDWQTFPTVSPLRDGDDGFPTRLDGITVSKHRAESIKAGGNAIVPQVAYEIFKAIEQYESSLDAKPHIDLCATGH